MERFKACEKEMKTKAFSKEGLIQAAKLDPKEQEKEDAMQWLQTQVEELQMQIEQTEAEIEALQPTGKKKKSGSTAGRLEELESLNERRKWHVSRLEIVLRLLNNGSLSTEKAVGLKDDVQYFVESNMVSSEHNSLKTVNIMLPNVYRKMASMRTIQSTTTSSLTRRRRNSA